MSEYTPSPYYMQTGGKGKPGLYYQPPAKKGSDGALEQPAAMWIADPFDVVARSRDGDSGNHGLVIEWQDPDRISHEWVMPFDLLAGDGVEIRKTLMNGGLRISTKKTAKEHLLNYLMEAKPKAVARAVFAIGWNQGAYVLPHQTIGG
ncbi:MAG: DUF927 domain-containing protein [Thiolinea sp.]